MPVLVTGGAGYIGSHTCVQLLKENYEVVVLDNLSNSSPKALQRIEDISGKTIMFYQADLLDRQAVERVFEENDITGVLHFAGLKAVGESVEKPLHYYHNNITGTLILCGIMKSYGVKTLVFSSSATVYGTPKIVPISEEAPTGATNPYGRTKLMIEEILQDLYQADSEWRIALLRYFNPIGADESGRIGEDPTGMPNNLMPFITQVAVGKREKLMVFGDDYDTPDGTGIRDYIHVTDLAEGHLRALEKTAVETGVRTYNLGTGTGYSVLDIVHAFQEATGVQVPYEIKERRPGDIAICYADPSLAEKELGWRAKKTIRDMCCDAWRWQQHNPNGYR